MPKKITLPFGITSDQEIDLEEAFLVQLEGKGPRYMIMANVTQEKKARVFQEMLLHVEENREWLVETWVPQQAIMQQFRLKSKGNELLEELGEENVEFLFQDGLTRFACIGVESSEEIFWGRLGILYIYTENVSAFKKSFKALAIPQKGQLNTLWSSVQKEGVKLVERSLKKEGKTVFQVIEKLGFVPGREIKEKSFK